MAETFQNGEANSSTRAKLNRNADQLDTVAQTLTAVSSAVQQAVARIAAIENAGDGGTTTTPVVSSDGALTDQTFDYHDAFDYLYQETGSSGQSWSKANSIAGYSGIGYAIVNLINATSGTEAVMTMGNLASDVSQSRVQVPRKLWVRVYSPVDNRTVLVKSDTGDPGTTLTTTTGGSWLWLPATELHPAYDNSIEFYGRSSLLSIDGVILTTEANTTTPTGKDGFRNS